MSYQYDPSIFGAEDAESIEEGGLRFSSIKFHTGDSAQAPSKRNPSDPGIRWRGGFYIAKENMNTDLTAYGWLEDSFISKSNGKEIECYYAPMLTICHIDYRRAWTVNINEKTTLYFPWNEGEKAGKAGTPRGLQQTIVFVQGLEDLGEFCLSLKGHAQMSFKGDDKTYAMTGVMSSFRRTVIQKAMDENKAATPKGIAAPPVPNYGFWVTMETSKNEDGTPKFFEVGKNQKYRMVLPVPVGLPADAKDVNLADFFVGNAMVNKARASYQMLKANGWKEAWSKFNNTAGEPEQKAPVKTVEANYAEEAGV